MTHSRVNTSGLRHSSADDRGPSLSTESATCPSSPVSLLRAEFFGRGNVIASTDCGRMSRYKTRPHDRAPKSGFFKTICARRNVNKVRVPFSHPRGPTPVGRLRFEWRCFRGYWDSVQYDTLLSLGRLGLSQFVKFKNVENLIECQQKDRWIFIFPRMSKRMGPYRGRFQFCHLP